MGLTQPKNLSEAPLPVSVQTSSGRHRCKWQSCGTPRKVGAAGYSTFPDPVGISQKPLEEVRDTKGPREGIPVSSLLVSVHSENYRVSTRMEDKQSKRRARLALCGGSSHLAASILAMEKPSHLAPAGHGHPLPLSSHRDTCRPGPGGDFIKMAASRCHRCARDLRSLQGHRQVWPCTVL